MLNNIRYANDIVIIDDSLENLQGLIYSITKLSAEYGYDPNVKKIKYMAISKKRTPNITLHVNQDKIERVQTYIYLSTQLYDQ